MTGSRELAASNRPTIQLYAQSLEPQARLKHRLWIGLRVEALLDGYWISRPTDAVKEQIVADWIDGLENFTQAEITAACREWVRDNPRKKPNFGDIRAVVLRHRQIEAAKHRKPEPEPYSALSVPSEERRAQAERILRDVFKKAE